MCNKRTLGMCPLDWLESGALVTQLGVYWCPNHGGTPYCNNE
jgi:hypothetical protein